ncbi:hypothetical protein [Escherichia coli]|uniref:hypothetical protein n=1 Tax=Escherichia coli TaxID=562 RepID=UPI001FCE8E6C|nr:hypothetical protein [Escherichia coli]
MMFRVNHIMRTINEMSFYTPHIKLNKFTDYLFRLKKISFCITLVSFYLLIVMAFIYGPFEIKNGLGFISALSLYFATIIAGGFYLSVPVIGALKYICNFKGEMINELIYDIDNDEQYIESLMPYSLEELAYASKCIHTRIQKVKSKRFFMERGEISVISILCLSYSSVCVISGINIKGVFFFGGIFDMVIILVMFFILHTSLISMLFKRKLRYLQKINSLIDMTLNIKRNFTS